MRTDVEPTGPWTIESVQACLPNVTIRYADSANIYPAQVSGRQNQFATVTRIGQPSTAWEFTWIAIARSLNSGRSLLV